MLEWKDSALSGPATIFSPMASSVCAIVQCGLRYRGSPIPRRSVTQGCTASGEYTAGAFRASSCSGGSCRKSAVTLPPVSASAAVAERALRDQEANREKDALRERAIRENDERIARQREAQRREDEQCNEWRRCAARHAVVMRLAGSSSAKKTSANTRP